MAALEFLWALLTQDTLVAMYIGFVVGAILVILDRVLDLR